jgi:hypothetical protein
MAASHSFHPEGRTVGRRGVSGSSGGICCFRAGCGAYTVNQVNQIIPSLQTAGASEIKPRGFGSTINAWVPSTDAEPCHHSGAKRIRNGTGQVFGLNHVNDSPVPVGRTTRGAREMLLCNAWHPACVSTLFQRDKVQVHGASQSPTTDPTQPQPRRTSRNQPRNIRSLPSISPRHAPRYVLLLSLIDALSLDHRSPPCGNTLRSRPAFTGRYGRIRSLCLVPLSTVVYNNKTPLLSLLLFDWPGPLVFPSTIGRAADLRATDHNSSDTYLQLYSSSARLSFHPACSLQQSLTRASNTAQNE